MKRNHSSDVAVTVVSYSVAITLCLMILLPLYLMLVDSFSTVRYYETPGIHWRATPLTLDSYKTVFAKKDVAIAYRNTIGRSVISTLLGVVITYCAAYSLSKQYLIARKFLTLAIVFTMYFSGGLIPGYLNISSLGLMNTFWVLVLPGLVSAYNIIVMRNSFYGIPPAIEESAMIDGANEYTCLFKILLPLSMPVIATVALWICVANWNSWYDAMIYTTNPNLKVLPLLIRNIIIENQIFEDAVEAVNAVEVTSGTIRAATIFVAIGPIILIYPFIQKYFVKGVMIGAVKQ